jgi:hypothetical protein
MDKTITDALQVLKQHFASKEESVIHSLHKIRSSISFSV